MRTNWKIDSTDSSVGFNIRHLMIERVYGNFDKISGILILDKQKPEESSVEVSIYTNSINTHNDERDDHIRSADFLDAEQFPIIAFKSTTVTAKTITGNLTVRGISRQVILDIEGSSEEFKDQLGMSKISFTASTELKLKEFNLTWNFPLNAGGLMIGDSVKVTLDVQFIKVD